MVLDAGFLHPCKLLLASDANEGSANCEARRIQRGTHLHAKLAMSQADFYNRTLARLPACRRASYRASPARTGAGAVHKSLGPFHPQ